MEIRKMKMEDTSSNMQLTRNNSIKMSGLMSSHRNLFLSQHLKRIKGIWSL
eukprot:403354805